jgi:hypothetical protein
MACLRLNVSVQPVSLSLSVSLFCDVGNIYYPLLVDDGYLFVEDNGVTYFLCVDKERKDERI